MSEHPDIGLIVAMQDEADVLASALGFAPRRVLHGTYLEYWLDDESIVLLTPGVDPAFTSQGHPISRLGKVSAAVVTSMLVLQFHPQVIINCGTAGGIAPTSSTATPGDLHIGDVIVADWVASHDIRVPLPGYEHYGTRKVPIRGLDKLSFLQHPHRLGTVSSGESFTTTADEWEILRKNAAVAKDMEAAGVLQAVQILSYAGGCFVVKAISDVSHERISEQVSSEEFATHFDVAMAHLTDVVTELLANKERLL
jgi:adenosylhomocysteine nucleosidase